MAGEKQNGTDQGNAVGPLRELNGPSDWKQWLSRELGGVKGNVDRAASLMASFDLGKNYVANKLTAKGLKTFQKPKVVILTDESAAHTPIGSAADGKVIFVKKTFLEDYSRLDTSAQYQVKRADGAVAFEGTIPDLFRLAGVEETHHSISTQIKRDNSRGIDPLSVSIPEYDAMEPEYKALKWQIRHAEEQNLPLVTLEKLKDRLEMASNVRVSKKRP